jgi:hypothetical protein
MKYLESPDTSNAKWQIFLGSEKKVREDFDRNSRGL